MKNNNKKGFTLIELLAIIVILAIIAVITVPIILNIIENSKKGAAQNSAHGYKDAVQKYMVSEFAKDSSYRLPSGTYDVQSVTGYLTSAAKGNLDVQISGQIPESGYIEISDNKITTGCLKFGDYNVSISNGEVGNATTEDCSRIAASTLRGKSVAQNTENPNNGPIAYDHTEISSTESVTDEVILSTTDYRYTGANPNNYILFNCTDYNNPDTETCEIWRIVSVEGDNLKIVKETSIGEINYNSTDSNDWSTSDTQSYLNGSHYLGSGSAYLDLTTKNNNDITVNNRLYLNGISPSEDSSFKLTGTTYNLIQPKTWYLGGVDITAVSTPESTYTGERTKSGVIPGNATKVENKKVGLLYPSDFQYAGEWIYLGSDEWTITPTAPVGTDVLATYITSENSVLFAQVNSDSNKFAIRPVVYLISNIGLKGTGSSSDPYTIVVY